MTNYLAKYGKPGVRRFQEGGPMPAEPGMEQPQGGGGEEQILALAQAAASGDMEAAAQLGMMLAPMILEQAGGGSAPAGPEAGMAPAEGAPMQRKGGVMLYRTGGSFSKPVFRKR